MGKKGVLVAAAFLSFWLSLSADSYRIMPNYGHLDSVVSLERDRERDTLISLGKDSGCLVVDLEQKRVLNRISLSGLPVRYNLNPVYPELALITEKEESFHLTLLNWQTGETLMERDEREMPYFLEYSRSGEFLLIGDGNIQFLSHDRGTAVEGPDGITDLLSFGYLGGSEKTFMGYSPSGSLIYYDRFTSQVKGRAETEEDLTDLTVLASDVRLLTARKGDTIMLINRQTGNILDTIEMENILSYHCQGDEDLITVLGRVDGEYTIGSYKIRKNRFSRESEKTFDADDYELTSALYAGGSYLMGTRDGTILTTGRRSRTIANLLTGNPLKISQLAMIDDRLILGNGSDELLIWESPFFEKELSPDYLLNLARKSVTVPLSEFRLASFSGKGVLWLPDNRTKYPYYLLSDDNTPVPLYEPEQNDPEDKPLAGFNREATFGFRELSFYDDLEVAMDEDKSCRVSRLTRREEEYSREELYTYSHPSLETTAMVSATQLALGSNTYFGGRNSINITNIFTGESVPLSDDRPVVTQFMPDSSGLGFYSLGFSEKEGTTYGVVKHHRLDNLFEEGVTVLEFPQPTTNQCRMSPGKEGSIYVTTPEGEWFTSGERKSFAGTFSLDQIVAHGGYIYRIEKDHSLVICRDDNLAELARVYFFDNGEWMALSGKGRHYFYSSGARELFTVYKVRN